MPSTYLKEYIRFKDVMHDDSEPTTPVTPRTSKSLWGNIKKAVNEVGWASRSIPCSLCL